MAITADYQIELTDTTGATLLLGPSTPYVVRNVDGLGAPPLRTSDAARPRDHGAWVGSDYMDARTVTLQLVVTGATAAATVAAVDTLKAYWYPTVAPAGRKRLAYRLPGDVAKELVGRTRRLDVDLDSLPHGYVPVKAEFYAGDPQIRSVADHNATLPVSSTTTGGRTYARTYSTTYTGGFTNAIVTVTNAGTIAARPTLVLYGPLTNPRVEHLTSDAAIDLALTIAAGEYLVIDFTERTVMLDGYASRYYALTSASTWFDLSPGANDVRLLDGAGSTTGRGVLTWHDAWI